MHVAPSPPDAPRSKEGDRRPKALIVKFGQIGDVIMAIPAVHALHERGYEIDWLCGRTVGPLLECYSWMNVISADDKRIFFGSMFSLARSMFGLWRRMMRKRYELCATLYYDFRYRLIVFPVRARQKRMLSSNRAARLLPGRHHSDEYARFLLGWDDGCRDVSMVPVRPDSLPSSPLERRKAEKRIAIVPGVAGNLLRQQVQGRSPEALRRWPIENFVAFSQRLLERGWEVVLLGGPDDAWVSENFHGLNVTNCVGTFSLPEVVSACDDCDAVVSNDTGPFHLAGLSSTCLIGIFGPTDPSTRVPRRPYSVGIWGGQGFACRPCYDGRDFAPCQFNGCMHQVTPELVIRELDRLLSDRDLGLNRAWRIVVPEENTGSSLFDILPRME
jgi:heptosyltransferase II